VSLDAGQALGAPHWPDADTSAGGLGQPVNGLECVSPSPIAYHVHSHLSVYLNGELLTIPQHIGIVEQTPTTECHYPLHTHNETGLVHIHAEVPTAFALGQFFDIWGHPLERDNVAGLMNLPVEVYITDDDVVSLYDGDLRDIELESHREITLQIGTPIAEIPRYTWTGP
jgi:hypothetical protein